MYVVRVYINTIRCYIHKILAEKKYPPPHFRIESIGIFVHVTNIFIIHFSNTFLPPTTLFLQHIIYYIMYERWIRRQIRICVANPRLLFVATRFNPSLPWRHTTVHITFVFAHRYYASLAVLYIVFSPVTRHHHHHHTQRPVCIHINIPL